MIRLSMLFVPLPVYSKVLTYHPLPFTTFYLKEIKIQILDLSLIEENEHLYQMVQLDLFNDEHPVRKKPKKIKKIIATHSENIENV